MNLSSEHVCKWVKKELLAQISSAKPVFCWKLFNCCFEVDLFAVRCPFAVGFPGVTQGFSGMPTRTPSQQREDVCEAAENGAKQPL